MLKEMVLLEKELEIRRIQGREELDEVYRLTHDCYVEQGYCPPQPDGRLVHYPQFDNIPETTVLVAVIDGQIVASISTTLDSAKGFSLDKDFRKECDQIRQEKRPMLAIWRLVTRKSHRTDRRIVLGLIGEMFSRSLSKGVQTLLFTVNPCHERVYQVLMNARTLAKQQEDVRGLSNAPGVLLRIDAERLPQRWLRPLRLHENLALSVKDQSWESWAQGGHRPVLRDLSEGGLCLETTKAMEPGDVFCFEIRIPGLGVVAGAAQCRWCRPSSEESIHAYGAKIVRLDESGAGKLKRYLSTV